MKKTIILICLMALNGFTLSQERWSNTKKPVIGIYSKLPNESNIWQNSNKTIKVYQTDNLVITVGPSIRVLPSANAQQDEIILVRHPSNQNIMFGGANTTVSGIFAQGGYITTDGGATWSGNNMLPPFTQSSSDPGPTIDKNGVIIFTVLDVPGIVAAYSTNNGSSWSSRITINSGSEDKNFAGTDDAPSSPYYGRSYCVWSHFVSIPPIVVSYTTNGGINWSPMSQINSPPGGHYSQGCDIACGPNGEVYVCWAAPISSSPFTEDFAGFAKSTNGGVSWTVTENIYDMNGIRASTFNGWNFRVNGFPRIGVDRSGGSRNGWIYIVTAERNLSPAGSDADVVMHYSSNGGTSWSTGIRVNQDPLNNGKVQFFPAIRVDEAGGINICYYDNRNYPSVGDSAETYMSRSTDGGATWIDIKVSDHAWKVKGEAGLGSYGGDYIGISSGNGKVWPFWYDDKTGTMQAWTAEVNLELVGVSNGNNGITKQYELKQNFPNPFNPNTMIRFSVPKSGHVSLEVFDISGKRVSSLLDGELKTGSYKFDFNASVLSSGVYFYKLIAAGFTDTKKMVLIK
ncbi:MAG: T9SS type A sorting domain-containing protein [Chlorobi bacterium]|nr:T9SS type A sorting domain-containing protein [Chlorobiota bacterium]